MIKFDNRIVVDIEVDGVKSWDAPDFSDAFFSYAVFEDNGQELSDYELDMLAIQNQSLLNELAHQKFI